HAGGDQHFRIVLAGESGAGDGEPGVAGRTRAAVGQAGDSHDADGKDEASAGFDQDGEFSAEGGEEWDLSAGDSRRREGGFESASADSMLAARWGYQLR